MEADQPAETRDDEKFDEARLAHYLAENVPELSGDLSVEQFHGGHANLTYALTVGDTQLVLRRPPLGPVAPRSHDMRREHKGLSALGPLYPHSPRAIHLCEDESIIGAIFFLMERRQGYVIRNDWPSELPDDPALRRQISESLIDALADLHTVDATRPELASLGKPEGFVERQVTGWFGRWEKAKTREIPAMEELGAWLLARIPQSSQVSVLHNDYKLDNAMYSLDEPGRLVAVFDWDMVTVGDPLVDLGTLLGYWTDPGDSLPRGTNQLMMQHPGFLDRQGLADRYAQRTGFDLAGLAFYETFALFKTAVVIEQIYVRWVRGQTKDDRFQAMGAMVPHLAEAAQLAASKA
ncbi:MAG: phosphotransferase family protein [Myxococcota bacterium]|nr:phosphotransferase family protein [Myxococcota bacterium]